MCSSESFLLLQAVNILVFLHGIISWAIKRRALMLQHFMKRTPFLSSGLSFKSLIPTQQDWVLAFLISPRRVNGRAFRLQAELRFLSETCLNISAHGMVASRIAIKFTRTAAHGQEMAATPTSLLTCSDCEMSSATTHILISEMFK